MFQSYNKTRILVCCLLTINALMAAISIFLLLTSQGSGQQFDNYIKALLSGVVLLAASYLIFRLHKKEIKALKLCYWFCLLQLITIENDNLMLGLTFGAKIGAVWQPGQTLVTLNLLALLTLLLVSRIQRGLKA